MIAFANNLSKKIFKKHDSLEKYLEHAKERCDELKNFAEFKAEDHIYSMETTKEELGLDDELIDSLLEDYVVQIITTLPDFRQIIKKMREDQNSGKSMDFKPLRDLAHKNLGVARNLRIKNAQKILASIMKKDDLDEVERFLEYLEACAILLKPEIAYRTYLS